MSPFLVKAAYFVAGLAVSRIGDFLYDWKVRPLIAKSHKRAEQREKEDADERAQEKQARLDRKNDKWKTNQEALLQVQEPLAGFNQMNRFPDRYKAVTCLEMAAAIERAARRLAGADYEEIKGKLLEYAGRRDRIDANTGLQALRAQFQRLIGEASEPMVLLQEVRRVIERNKVPPYSEKDV